MRIRSIRVTAQQKSKKRVWTCVVYPESLPADWIDIIKQSGLKCAISPLHDRDYNIAQVVEENREPKKEHYHLILVYGNPTTFANVSKFTQGTLCGTIPQPLESVEGMYRYFTHKDNPEKAQYDEKDIQSFNGFNIYDFVDIKKTEVLKIKQELQDLIIAKNFVEYCDFIDYVRFNEDMGHYDVATSNTIFFEKYIASRRNSITSRNHAKKALKEHNKNDNNN